ncbi:MAG TPA: undecaprenyl/decaprenyl-phosphate alpha-N-acetylglucosaminyl 1-phosphate transferase [Candidatus Acetothermia bacterium]|nr:undecaprenyl/decaprenyl-phosphate alpha-N-acetylglucosaminyl 1-phosphate transferase [Candidatus Acetothermia bacterium]
MHISLSLAAFLIAAIATLLGAFAILRARTRWGLVARGDGRAIGGPALVAGVVLAVASTARIDLHLIIGGILIILVGTIDDLIDLSPWQKLIGQGAAAGIVAAGIASSPQAPIVPALMGVATFVWIVLLTNAVNLIDGLDGLLIGTIAPAMVVLILISVATGDLFTLILASACAGALLGFLPFNWAHARLLLGDTGSEFIGFFLAVLTVISFVHRPHSSSIPIFFLIAAVPISDTAFAIIRRLVHHRSIFAGDTGHIHHRLARLIGERRSIALLSSISILTSAAAFLVWHAGM